MVPTFALLSLRSDMNYSIGVYFFDAAMLGTATGSHNTIQISNCWKFAGKGREGSREKTGDAI